MTTPKVVLALAALGLVTTSSGATPAKPKEFDSPQAAADALVESAANQDVPALLAIFGPDGRPLVSSGDEVMDRNDRGRFAELGRARTEAVRNPRDERQATVTVGNERWPFPVPLVEKSGRWSFATKKGLQEVLDRRIGADELDAIQICRGYVEAQHEYAEEDRNGDGVLEYAQKVISGDGKRDGLVWRNPDGSLGGPVAEPIATAIAEGYSDKTSPYHGYYFRILKRQGRSAPLGAMDYVINGRMIGGFALVAWPAEYRLSGVKTFIVSHDGIVYEKDLGRDTQKVASRIDRFDPDKTWKPVP